MLTLVRYRLGQTLTVAETIRHARDHEGEPG